MKLDKLKQITDLREVWPNEAKDFTVNTQTNVLTAGVNVNDTDHTLTEYYKKFEQELLDILGVKSLTWRESDKSSKFLMSKTIKLKDNSTWVNEFEWLCEKALILRKFVKTHNKD